MDGDDFTVVARRFRVGVSTLRLWRRQAREGRCTPLRMDRGPALLGSKLDVLNQLAAERRIVSLAEYADLPPGRVHGRVDQHACGLLRVEAARLGAQPKTLRVCEQQRRDMAAARTTWRKSTAVLDPTRLIFVDKSGFDTRLTRTHARALLGQRAYGTAPDGHWQRLILIGAMVLGGTYAAMTSAAATGTAMFLAFVEQVLIPVLKREQPDAIVVMDHRRAIRNFADLAAHKAACVREALRAVRINSYYLPAYSPDMNLIELAWSKLKTLPHSVGARTRVNLAFAIPDALAATTSQDAQGRFRHAGYAPN